MHIPVLLNEVIKYLDPKSGGDFIDGTFGLGGHAREIAKRIFPGRLLGIERDLEMVWHAGKLPENIKLVHGSYYDIREIALKNGFEKVDGIVLDLGFSSFHVDKSGRGFSFRFNEPLDMRYDVSSGDPTAEDIVNKYGERELTGILKDYGEERFARRIAENIVNKRKKEAIKTTFQLVEVVAQSVPFRYKRGRIHFATRTFQALRIEVNDELNGLRNGLSGAKDILKSGGRLAVISFHSLEDRIVKNFFRDGEFEKLTKKPVQPDEKEIKTNPRARSAKLRAAAKK